MAGVGMGLASRAARTHLTIRPEDLDAIIALRERAAVRIEEMRRDLEAAQAELAVLDEAIFEALEKSAPDDGHLDAP